MVYSCHLPRELTPNIYNEPTLRPGSCVPPHGPWCSQQAPDPGDRVAQGHKSQPAPSCTTSLHSAKSNGSCGGKCTQRQSKSPSGCQRTRVLWRNQLAFIRPGVHKHSQFVLQTCYSPVLRQQKKAYVCLYVCVYVYMCICTM